MKKKAIIIHEPDSHKSVYDLLKKTPYGLASEEVSKKIGVSRKNTKKLLDEMAHKKKITKTKAGMTFFYRFIAVLLLAAAVPIHAEELTSTNYKIVAEIVDAAGGNVTTPTNRTLLLSMSHVSSVKLSESYELCAGFLCNFLDILSV